MCPLVRITLKPPMPTLWPTERLSGAQNTMESGDGQLTTHPREAGGSRTATEPGLHTPWHMLHCPIGLHLHNTNSKIKLLRTLRQRLQCLELQTGDPSGCVPLCCCTGHMPIEAAFHAIPETWLLCSIVFRIKLVNPLRIGRIA